MRRRNSPDSLKLNSYKIDSSKLQSSLRELHEMKSELETTISQYRINQECYQEQNERLREEIAMLQRKKDCRIDHFHCEEQAGILRQELENQRKETEKYKSMYEVECRNKEEISHFYQKKLENWQSDSKLLVENYEQRINSLKAQITQVRSIHPSIVDSHSKSINSPKLHHQASNYQSESEPSNLPKTSPNLDSKANLVKPFVSEQNIQKHRAPTPTWKNPEEQTAGEEQIFESSIRKLYLEIKQMKISPKQALTLPQFRKIKNNANPSVKDLAQFFKHPPVSEKKQLAEKNAMFLMGQAKRKYRKISGSILMEYLLTKVEEYQEAEHINSEDLQISGVTPSLNKPQTSYDLSSLERSGHSNQLADRAISPRHLYGGNRPNLTDGLKIESDGSFIQ